MTDNLCDFVRHGLSAIMPKGRAHLDRPQLTLREITSMRAISAASFLVSVAFAATAFAAAAPSYKIVDRIKVQDGGFDYATYDATNGRILMARPTLTTVIDTKTGKVSELASAKGGHIAMPIPGSSLLAVTQRAGNVLLVD